jgi:hypothetical protein
MSGESRLLRKALVAGLVALMVLGLLSSVAFVGKSFGDKVNPTKYPLVSLDEVFANTAQYLNKTIIVPGPVGTVCQTSGCWLILGDGANQLFVQFFDFTVRLAPKTKVRVQGELRKKNNAPYLVGQGLEVQ